MCHPTAIASSRNQEGGVLYIHAISGIMAHIPWMECRVSNTFPITCGYIWFGTVEFPTLKIRNGTIFAFTTPNLTVTLNLGNTILEHLHSRVHKSMSVRPSVLPELLCSLCCTKSHDVMCYNIPSHVRSPCLCTYYVDALILLIISVIAQPDATLFTHLDGIKACYVICMISLGPEVWVGLVWSGVAARVLLLCC